MRSAAIGSALFAAIVIAVASASASCSTFDSTGDDTAPPAQRPGDGSAAPPDQSAPDAAGDAAPTATADAAPPPPKTYTSCADAKSHSVSVDGDILVDVDGPGPLEPFTIYCTHMAQGVASEADDYLSLVSTTNPTDPTAFTIGKNVSGWAEGGDCACADPNVVRAFQRVRIVLSATAPIVIYLDDPTFSATNRSQSACESSTPSCAAFVTPASNFGVAAGCNTSMFGRGNVDLTGTPFHVAASEVGMANGGSTGTTTYSADRKVVDTTSGGSCGHQFPGNKSNLLAVELD